MLICNAVGIWIIWAGIYIYLFINFFKLWQASENGGNALNFAARREKIYLPDFEHYGKAPISSESMEMRDIDLNNNINKTRL